MKEVLSLNDLSKDDILDILNRGKAIENNESSIVLTNKILVTAFFEPSTRTKLSFISSMYRLGGKVISFDEGGNTSLKKGESISDTIRMLGLYGDILAIRSPLEGCAKRASELLEIPVINAGDGSNQHPTQTLLDLYTIEKEFGSLDNLNITFVGDLKYGRTVHSLVKALDKFKGNKVTFVSPKSLEIPSYITEELNLDFKISHSLKEALPETQVLYMTRIQRERIEEDIQIEMEDFTIHKEMLKKGRKDLRILHPLPRIDEVNNDLDDTPNAVYFEQAKNGLFVRQGILSLLMERFKKPSYSGVGYKCSNSKCISNHENLAGKYIEDKGKHKCFYCEK